MELNEFRNELLTSSTAGSQINGNYRRSEFVDVVMKMLVESDVIHEFSPCFHDGFYGAHNKKVMIDGYDFDDFDGTLSIVICKFNGIPDEESRFTGTEIKEYAEYARRFIEGSLDKELQSCIEESEPAYELSTYIDNIRQDIARIRIFILSDLQASSNLGPVKVEDVRGVNVEINLWDLNNLYRQQIQNKGYGDLIIPLSKYGFEPIPCIRTTEKRDNNVYESYLCAIPGKFLSDIYESYGSRLLESNVRSFLKSTTPNKGIKATILKEPEMFFAYNNGLTTTVSALELEESEHYLRIRSFENLQIVNGGQTTVMLYTVAHSADEPDLSKVFVPMKIAVVVPDDSAAIVRNISKSANTQNKVTASDFFSSSPFHREMEILSRKIPTPISNSSLVATYWYYERVRGQYNQELDRKSKGDQTKFKMMYPKRQIITKNDLAKFRMSYMMHPDIVSKGSQEALKGFGKLTPDEDRMDMARYNEVYYKESVAMAIIFKHLEELIPKQPWYNNGYRAQLVTYTFARLSKFAEELGGSLDLMSIWNNQSVSESFTYQAENVAYVVNQGIAVEKEEENIGQWCKKARCWEKIKNAPVEEYPGFRECLVNKAHQKFERRIATRDKRERNYMNALIEVVQKGSEYWQNVLMWGIEHNTLNTKDRGILNSACDLQYRRPSEKQAVAIMKILDRLIDEGFSG